MSIVMNGNLKRMKIKTIENMLKECDAVMLDMRDKNFAEELELALNTVGGCTDYRNDMERPYDGQPHTSLGTRGKTLVEGLTMRDIKDCMVKGFLIAAGKSSFLEIPISEWDKWWVYKGRDKYDDGIYEPTPEMKERLKKNEFVGDNVKCGTWRYMDIYHIENDFDPMAVLDNTMCEIEKMMGIFPNVPKIKEV